MYADQERLDAADDQEEEGRAPVEEALILLWSTVVSQLMSPVLAVRPPEDEGLRYMLFLREEVGFAQCLFHGSGYLRLCR